jgi:type I restriction enzyme, S subunit
VTLTVHQARRLPPEWRLAPLLETIAELQAGFASSKRDPSGVIQLRMNNVDTRGNFVWDHTIRVPADEEYIARYALKPDDVMFNNTNSTELVGKSALFEGFSEPVVYSNHFTRLRTRRDILLPSFLAAWLNHQWREGVFAEICDKWIGQSGINSDRLTKLQIPVPPLAEQNRIIAQLRDQLSAIEKARSAALMEIETIDALPRALLRYVFMREA